MDVYLRFLDVESSLAATVAGKTPVVMYQPAFEFAVAVLDEAAPVLAALL
jgi:hypothetical protein